MRCRPGLRQRLTLAALALAGPAVLAAGLSVYGLARRAGRDQPEEREGELLAYLIAHAGRC